MEPFAAGIRSGRLVGAAAVFCGGWVAAALLRRAGREQRSAAHVR